MVREANLAQSFTKHEENGGIQFIIRQRIKLNLIVALAIWWVFVTPGLAAVVNNIEALPILSILSWGVAAAFVVFYIKKRRLKITVTQDGVVANNRLYKYENIMSIGFKNAYPDHEIDSVTLSGNIRGMIAKTSYRLYLVYGTKKVDLCRGQNEYEVSSLYNELIAACARFGRSFTN